VRRILLTVPGLRESSQGPVPKTKPARAGSRWSVNRD